jgi:hypothetical protein
MKIEGYMFAGLAVFFLIMAPVYWFLSYDPTGTAALVLTLGLCLLVGYYLVFTGRRLPPRPEDRKDAEVADGTGELGFFSPHSVWPLFVGLAVAFATAGVAVGWWLFIIGAAFTGLTVTLFVLEYYRHGYEG